jgi:hypothetical protein
MNNMYDTAFKIIGLINGSNILYEDLYKGIPATNEDRIMVNKLIPVANKDILLTAASGDQYIEAIMSGVKQVTLFDKNLLAKYITNLKIASIKTFTNSDDFKNFILVGNKDFFSKKDFNFVKEKLPKEDSIMWEFILERISHYNIGNMFYNYSPYSYKDLPLLASFYSEDGYKEVRKRIVNSEYPKFYNIGFDTIPNTFKNSSFGIVDLSNIIEDMVFNDYLDDEGIIDLSYKMYLEKAKNILRCVNENGVIIANYLLSLDEYKVKLMKDNGLEVISFDTKKEKNAICVYQK